MEYSITEALYQWMHQRRIVTVVAQHMGIKDSTLSSKLRPTTTQARLSADELIPLFEAIRKVGYGKELEGILHGITAAMHGGEPVKATTTTLIPQVLALAKGVGVLSDTAGKISKISDETELQKLCTMVRTELLPIVLQVECLLMQRMEKIRRTKRTMNVPLEVTESPTNL